TVPPAKYTGSVIMPWRPASDPGSRMPDHESAFLQEDSPDVPVTGETDVTQSENSVFIDPEDEEAVLNSNNSTSWKLGAAQDTWGSDALYSIDGGQNWEGSTRGTNGDNNGDPSTAIGSNGWLYMGRIDHDNGQAVSYSMDKGLTWTKVTVAHGPGQGNSLLDKNHLWIDNAQGSPYNGYLYDAWTNFIPGSSNYNQIEFAHSADQGLTWSLPVDISSAAAALELNHGVNIQTGPDGEVYVVWSIYDTWPADENAIGFARSLNGGNVFFPATRIISNIKGIRATMTGKAMRVNGFPSMAVDNSSGPNRGNLYVVWTNVGFPGINTGSDIDVYLIRSEDGGSTWSAPIRVNQDPAGLGKQHFFPWITCDPVTGWLCVVYYDDRNLPSTDASVFVSWSYDGGLTWTDMQVSDYTFTPTPIPGLAYNYFGDYIGIQSRNLKIYPVWTDNHDNGRPMTYASPFYLGPDSNQPWVVYYSNSLSPVTGGGTTTMNNGDSLYLSLGLKNVGDQQAVSLEAIISTGSPYITITDSSASYGTMDAAQVKTVQNGYTFRVSDTIPDNLLVRFKVRVSGPDSSWYSQFSIEAHAPAVTIGGLSIVDTLQGNRNGRLDPGETVQLVVPNANKGDFSCKPAYVKLSAVSPYLSLLSDSIFIDSIAPGEVKNAVFTANVSEDASNGSGADIHYSIRTGAYNWSRSFRPMIGIMIEDWESTSFKKYPWQLSGTLPWTIIDQNPWEGIYCARSGAIPDYSSSKMLVDYISAVDDSISFYLRTSTEDGCDFLLFDIDSVRQGQWSGEIPWTRVAFPVNAGQHAFAWIYHKDLSFYSGEDRVMTDFIVFPPPILPVVQAAANDTICAGTDALLQATVQQYDSLKWTTNGDGAFGNDTLSFTTYVPGSDDLARGHVTCRITAYGTYGNTGRNVMITINPRPVTEISVFPNDTVCAGQAVFLSVDTTGNSGYLWTPGNVVAAEAVFDTALAGGSGTHLVRLTTTSRLHCQSQDSVWFTFKNCTSATFSALIYPNPGNGRFMVEVNTPAPGPLQLEISNAISEMCYSEFDPLIASHHLKKLNLEFLPDGVYLLSLTTSHGTDSKKLIIRK
ncbi:MAG TPA: T9SS type A sorting domain-containing protein, partial [Bacteroidales bacterium]|nr:T9SS type A sorting domain-containing protein [Bacteroidales bacterium]